MRRSDYPAWQVRAYLNKRDKVAAYLELMVARNITRKVFVPWPKFDESTALPVLCTRIESSYRKFVSVIRVHVEGT